MKWRGPSRRTPLSTGSSPTVVRLFVLHYYSFDAAPFVLNPSIVAPPISPSRRNADDASSEPAAVGGARFVADFCDPDQSRPGIVMSMLCARLAPCRS